MKAGESILFCLAWMEESMFEWRGLRCQRGHDVRRGHEAIRIYVLFDIYIEGCKFRIKCYWSWSSQSQEPWPIPKRVLGYRKAVSFFNEKDDNGECNKENNNLANPLQSMSRWGQADLLLVRDVPRTIHSERATFERPGVFDIDVLPSRGFCSPIKLGPSCPSWRSITK